MDRREYLELLAAGGAAGVAGCAEQNQETTDEPPADDVPTTESTPTPQPTSEAPSTETTTSSETTTTADPPSETETQTEQPTDSPTTETPNETPTEQPTTEEPTTDELPNETPTEQPTTEQPTTDSPTTETPNETPTEQPTTEEPTTDEPTTDEPAQASFELLSFEVPDEKVIIGEAFTYSFTVQNTGTSTGEFSTLITIVNDEGISHPYKPFEWTATIEPGETVTFESEPLTSWWDSSPWYIQLSAFDAEQSVWFSRPRLEFGEWFELGNGLRMTMQYDADEVHFDHETVAFCPDQSHAYVWVEVEVPDGVGWPDYYQLFLLSGGEWAYAKMGRHPGYYLYGVPESSTKTGWLTFEVSETFSENDVTVSWEDEDAIGSTGAYWTNNPAALP